MDMLLDDVHRMMRDYYHGCKDVSWMSDDDDGEDDVVVDGEHEVC